MNKINFEDATVVKGAYVVVNGEEVPVVPAQTTGGTDLNKATFDTLQNNVEEGINSTILYDNSAGNSGTTTLNDSVANYKKIIIQFRDDNNIYSSVTVENPNDKKAYLGVVQFEANSQVVLRGKNIQITGNQIINGDYCAVVITTGANTLYWNNNIFITRVDGYKY